MHSTYPQVPENHSTHRIEIKKEVGAYMLLTSCPSCILSFEKGLELMQESGKPMEFWIFDFYRVFSRALGEEGNGAVGT